MLYQGPFSTAFYRQLHRAVHHEFRLRQAWRKIFPAPPVNTARRFLPGKPAAAGRGRALLEILYHGLKLPIARLKLSRLEKAPHRSIPLRAQRLSPAEAAAPSRQTE
jgi:anaerobic magnesium-protoporphyrin IX monomethyl ester cyclase